MLNGYVFLLEPGEAGESPLLIDAYDGGGSACMINDHRRNPFADAATAAALRQQQPTTSNANVRFVKCRSRGWPHLFIVSSQPLRAGEELLLDYGELYWKSRREACLGARQTVPTPSSGDHHGGGPEAAAEGPDDKRGPEGRTAAEWGAAMEELD